jgi:GTP-binding protein Era
MNDVFRCGFVAILGRPNVGKSTLINALLGEKVAIVSGKPQTTRSRIQGILNRPDAQIIFIDTPGMTALGSAIHQLLRRVIRQAASSADINLLMVVAREGPPVLDPLDEQLIGSARKDGRQIVVALNKIDQIRRKAELLPWIDFYAKATGAKAVVPISALQSDGLERLVAAIVSLLPEGPTLFPAEMVTDQAERFMASELVREQVLAQTHEEVPHSVAVQIDEFVDDRTDQAKPRCHLTGRLIVERESQKAILVGKRGSRIKGISTAARKQIEELLGCSVFLRLTVAVDPNWTRDHRSVERYGIGPAGAGG